MRLRILQGDITKLKVDVIVNAANSELLGGGGVDGAIHAAAGPGLLEECRLLRERDYPSGLPTGKAVITDAYDLSAKKVIHAVGPIYNEVANPKRLLTDAYRNSLVLAEKHMLKSIAFPAISTGVYGYPKKDALEVVMDVIRKFKYHHINEIILCFYSKGDTELAKAFFHVF